MCRARVRWNDVLLGPRPFLLNPPLKVASFFVRLVHRCRVGGGALAALASVRRSNCTDGFPVCSFHDEALLREASEGIN